jgi:hypothetical protein
MPHIQAGPMPRGKYFEQPNRSKRTSAVANNDFLQHLKEFYPNVTLANICRDLINLRNSFPFHIITRTSC